MNFDVRSYAMRLAKADPKRFEFIEYNDDYVSEWGFVDHVRSRMLEDGESISTLWAFVGPLADELGVDGEDIGVAFDNLAGCPPDALLEATFAAVAEKLESAKP